MGEEVGLLEKEGHAATLGRACIDEAGQQRRRELGKTEPPQVLERGKVATVEQACIAAVRMTWSA